ncbi:hypothetical protein [Streptomyces sp. NPDC057694]|uniref:hypothetical protein n=1 Tax=Streptomyces sp. NPDC057694 TaxID=3346216 RepID=UPI00368A95E5
MSDHRTNLGRKPDSHDFPNDLLAAQKHAATLYAELHHFAIRPHSALVRGTLRRVGVARGTARREGRRLRIGPARLPGWNDDDKVTYEQLWRDLETATAKVSTHRHWSTYSGPDLVAARMALKHHPATPTTHELHRRPCLYAAVAPRPPERECRSISKRHDRYGNCP